MLGPCGVNVNIAGQLGDYKEDSSNSSIKRTLVDEDSETHENLDTSKYNIDKFVVPAWNKNVINLESNLFKDFNFLFLRSKTTKESIVELNLKNVDSVIVKQNKPNSPRLLWIYSVSSVVQLKMIPSIQIKVVDNNYAA